MTWWGCPATAGRIYPHVVYNIEFINTKVNKVISTHKRTSPQESKTPRDIILAFLSADTTFGTPASAVASDNNEDQARRGCLRAAQQTTRSVGFIGIKS